jgi:purine-binding chemotaxis protein CheW
MKNVLVFSHEGSRYAVELRWVREVFTLGFITPVPGAPPVVAGLTNLRGAITPVLDLGALVAPSRPPTGARDGDSAVLLEVEGMVAAMPIAAVDEVATLRHGPEPAALVDSRGRSVEVLDPPALFRTALEAANTARGLSLPAGEAPGG